MARGSIKIMSGSGQKYLKGRVRIVRTMTVKVEIDQEDCIQCGKCYNDECSEVYMEGEDGTSEVVEQYRDGSSATGKVPDDLFDCANRGAEECPITVITVTKE
jgi:ferredoxin